MAPDPRPVDATLLALAATVIEQVLPFIKQLRHQAREPMACRHLDLTVRALKDQAGLLNHAATLRDPQTFNGLPRITIDLAFDKIDTIETRPFHFVLEDAPLAQPYPRTVVDGSAIDECGHQDLTGRQSAPGERT